MKIAFALIVLILIALGVAYVSGGFASPSPEEQAAQFRQTVKEGMTWEEVVAIKEPKKYHYFNPDAMGGRAPDTPFDRAAIADAVANKRFELGFGFDYNFSAGEAYSVAFDTEGKVVGVEKKFTEKDLLEGKLFHGGE